MFNKILKATHKVLGDYLTQQEDNEPSQPLVAETDSTKNNLGEEEWAVQCKEVRQLVSQGKLSKALEVLAATGMSDISPLQNQLRRLEKNRTMGIISSSEWYRESARMSQTILTLISPSKVIKKPLSVPKIHQLLKERKMEEALQLLAEAGYEEAILLQGRLQTLEQQLEKGTISGMDYTRHINQLEYSVKKFEDWLK